MQIEQQIKHYEALTHWFNSPLGLSVASEFSNELDPFKDILRGDTLLQLGNCGDNPWLDHFNFQHKWLASPFALDTKIDLQCSLNQIPLNRNSVDCILAPLTMEPFGNSNSLIDEIDRVLKPMGFIVLLCLNPWSLWGAAMKLGLLQCYSGSKIKMRTPFHVNRIFLQRGYRQCALSNFCYIPPINSKTAIKKLTFLDEVGKMIWPLPSGFYCYIAQKFEYIAPSLIPQPILETNKSSLQPAINI